MSIEHTAKVMDGYWSGHDPDAIAPDAIFTDVGTGRQWRGREAIGEMLRFFYEEAFEAEFVPETRYIADGLAGVEGRFVGKHIGAFGGVEATGKDVDVPLAVFYTVEDRGITAARVWFMFHNYLEQVG